MFFKNGAMALSQMTLGIMTPSIARKNTLLNVTILPIMQCLITLSVMVPYEKL